MPPVQAIQLGPVRIEAENFGWYSFLNGPTLRGYYGEVLQWTCTFAPEQWDEAFNVWFSFRAMQLFGQEQADAVAKLSTILNSFKTHFAEEQRKLGEDEPGRQHREQVARFMSVLDDLQRRLPIADGPIMNASLAPVAPSTPSSVTEAAPVNAPHAPLAEPDTEPLEPR